MLIKAEEMVVFQKWQPMKEDSQCTLSFSLFLSLLFHATVIELK